MSDVNRSDPVTAVQSLELCACFHTQARIQIRQRLVHQKHDRSSHDRAPQRDPLALAAGELGRFALQELAQIERLRHFADLGIDRVFVLLAHTQGKGDVLVDIHVRVKRVALKDHGHIALAGRQRAHLAIVEVKRTGAYRLEASDHVEHGRFTAAARANEGEELLILDQQIEIVHDQRVAKALLNLVEADAGHALALHRSGG